MQPADDLGELLDDAEIQRLTGRTQPAAQVRALKRKGIPARLEAGHAIASRHHMRQWLEGAKPATAEPNWNGVS